MKEIGISLEIKIALKQHDVHWIEEELLRLRAEVFQDILMKVLRAVEEEALGGQEKCRGCGGTVVRNGSDEKKIRTLLGAVRVKRARVRCSACGEEHYPLDEELGLEGGEGTTIGVRERALWTAVEVSYEKAERFLEKFTGLEVSRKKIYTMAQEEGARIGVWEEKRRGEVFGEGGRIRGPSDKGPEVLYVQVDGTGVNERERRGWMECKVGASFSQRVLVSKKRVWLKDKRTYASVEGAEAFGEKFYLDCVGQGVLGAEKVIFVSDGANWIRKLKQDYFPDALGVLDIWHLERAMRLALGADEEELVQSLKALARQGEAREIAKRLMEQSRRCGDVRQALRIIETADYVLSNRDWIENIPQADGYGSGPIEKTVDITVSRRFKRRGMSWHRQRVNPLLKLRLLKLNGEWDQYWDGRRQELARCAA